jgi:hypothetical protein
MPFFRPTQLLALTQDRIVWYVVPDTLLRVERYNSDALLLTETFVSIHPRASDPAHVLQERDQRLAKFRFRVDIDRLERTCKTSVSIECLTFRYFDSSAKLTRHYPIATMAVASSDDGLWLQSEAGPSSDSVRWTHFASTGVPDGQIRLPVDRVIAAASARDLVVRHRTPVKGNLGIEIIALAR